VAPRPERAGDAATGMTMTQQPTAYAPADLGGMLVPIVTFRSEADNWPAAKTVTWSDLRGRLTRHAIRAAKDGSAWSPATYKPGTRRAKANVEWVHAMVLDVDHVDLPYDQLAGLAWVAHTTHSHNPPDDPRWRVVIPLLRPVSGAEAVWSTYWLRARERFGNAMDEACKDSSRLYFWPACRLGAPHRTEIGVGELLDPDELPQVSVPEYVHTAAPRRAWAGSVNAYARRALEDEVTNVATAPPGNSPGSGRNVQLNRSAFALGQLVAGGELPRGLVEQELLAAAEHCGLVNDDGVHATEKTIQSGLTAGERQPRQAPEPTEAPQLLITRRTVDPVTGEVLEEDDGFQYLPPLTRPRGRKLPPLCRPEGVSLPPLIRERGQVEAL
jgi:hypothetical protein